MPDKEQKNCLKASLLHRVFLIKFVKFAAGHHLVSVIKKKQNINYINSEILRYLCYGWSTPTYSIITRLYYSHFKRMALFPVHQTNNFLINSIDITFTLDNLMKTGRNWIFLSNILHYILYSILHCSHLMQQPKLRNISITMIWNFVFSNIVWPFIKQFPKHRSHGTLLNKFQRKYFQIWNDLI